MKNDDCAIALNDSDFLLVDWAYCFPNVGYIGRLVRNGQEVFKTGFFKDRKECVEDAVGKMADMRRKVEQEMKWIDSALAKMEEQL